MVFAGGATLLFSCSVIFARRAAGYLGPWYGFVARTVLAAMILLPLAFLSHPQILHHPAAGWFLLSGLIGFGLSDMALFRSLEQIGSRLSLLMVQCLAAPFAVVMEWAWLNHLPPPLALLWGAVILLGVGLALAPSGTAPSVPLPGRGLVWGTLAAAGQGAGAVLSRHGFGIAAESGLPISAFASTALRLSGGLLFILLLMLFLRPRLPAMATLRQGGAWSLANALAGPVLGVTCYQAALRDHPSGLVLPIVATAPLVVIPLAWWIENDRPRLRAWIGTALAALGVAALTLQ